MTTGACCLEGVSRVKEGRFTDELARKTPNFVTTALQQGRESLVRAGAMCDKLTAPIGVGSCLPAQTTSVGLGLMPVLLSEGLPQPTLWECEPGAFKPLSNSFLCATHACSMGVGRAGELQTERNGCQGVGDWNTSWGAFTDCSRESESARSMRLSVSLTIHTTTCTRELVWQARTAPRAIALTSSRAELVEPDALTVDGVAQLEISECWLATVPQYLSASTYTTNSY